MLFASLFPSNIFGSSLVLTPNITKEADNKSFFISQHHHHHRRHRCREKEQDQKQSYSLLKRRWQLSRRHSEDCQTKSCCILERRLSLISSRSKEFKQEMTTPGESNANWWRISRKPPKRSISLRFWRNDADDYHTALDNLDISSDKDIDRLCGLVRNHIKKKHLSATELAEIVQEIYKTIEADLRQGVLFELLTPERAHSLMTTFEEHFMRNFHEDVFQRIQTEEKQSDAALTAKIEDLYWVSSTHLQAKINESDRAVWNLIDKAMLDLAAISFKESAIEKLGCILDCSRRIFEILRTCGKGEGADDFLPVFIYVVLLTNPIHLHSNIRYILQFCNADRFMKGEEGYYFTQLCSVVSYIENLNAESLGMTEQQFRSYSQHDAQAHDEVTDLNGDISLNSRRLSRYICDVYHRAAEQKIFKDRQDDLWERSVALKKQIAEIRESIAARRAKRQSVHKRMQELMKVNYREVSHKSSCPPCIPRSETIQGKPTLT